MLDECQIYRRGRGTVWEEAIFSRFPSPPAINDDVRPLGKYETKMAAPNEKRSILTDFTKKKGDCEQYWGKHAQKPKLAIQCIF